jgi:hypothetical protein
VTLQNRNYKNFRSINLAELALTYYSGPMYSRAFVKQVKSFVHVAFGMYVISCRSKSPVDYFV